MEQGDALYRMFGKYYPQGSILFSENDPAEEMFYVQSGRLCVTRSGEGGDPPEKRDLGPGDLLGEDSFIGLGRRKAMAEAAEDSRLLVIDPGNMDSVVRNGPDLAGAIMEKLIVRLKTSLSSLHNWQCAFGAERVRKLLQTHGGKTGWRAGEVSSETGMEESVVRRILAEMTRAGALNSEGDSYSLKDEGLLGTVRFGVGVRADGAESRG